MTTTFIGPFALFLPKQITAGSPMTETDAEILCQIQFRRIVAKLRYLLKAGQISMAELQSKALELSKQPLVPYLTLDDEGSENDPILNEALNIARELIVSRMASEGLPPPKGLDIHARALVDGMPQLQEKARLRLEAHYRAAEEAIGK